MTTVTQKTYRALSFNPLLYVSGVFHTRTCRTKDTLSFVLKNRVCKCLLRQEFWKRVKNILLPKLHTMTIAQELDAFVEAIPTISITKKYWLVRTQSGSLYDTFTTNGLIALDHSEIGLSALDEITKNYSDPDQRLLAIRARVRTIHEKVANTLEDEDFNSRQASLVGSQIYKFVYELKKGDVVVIPSAGSNFISFGEVTENHIGNFSQEELRKIETNAILKKRVKWIKDIKRVDLDPYLYRIFSAHQALNDISSYADIVERSLRDFFILDDEAHLIINIQSHNEIPASDLFGLGSDILRMVDEFAQLHNLPVKSSDFSVSISLNSPGKIDLKSKIRKTTVITGLILAGFGGGYQSKDGSSLKTDGMPGLVKAVSEFIDDTQDRKNRQEVFNKYKDSLQVKSPDDMVKLLKQFGENKDVPK